MTLSTANVSLSQNQRSGLPLTLRQKGGLTEQTHTWSISLKVKIELKYLLLEMKVQLHPD
jgi:hypothetical protein